MFSHLPKDGVVILRWQAPLSRIERDAKKALHRVCAETQRQFWHPPDLSRSAGTSKWR
jgi:hypothetical protein